MKSHARQPPAEPTQRELRKHIAIFTCGRELPEFEADVDALVREDPHSWVNELAKRFATDIRTLYTAIPSNKHGQETAHGAVIYLLKASTMVREALANPSDAVGHFLGAAHDMGAANALVSVLRKHKQRHGGRPGGNSDRVREWLRSQPDLSAIPVNKTAAEKFMDRSTFRRIRDEVARERNAQPAR